MKISLICGILFLAIIYGCNHYYPTSVPKCMQCIIKLQESQNSVEAKLGKPTKINKNQNGSFIATYSFSFPVNETNPINTFNKTPLVYKCVTHIIILYDKDLKVKNYWFERNTKF